MRKILYLIKLCYTYDNLSRVIKRTVKNLSNTVLGEEVYTYDAAGNVTDAPDTCFLYDTNNRLITFCGNAVSYDLDGNMLSNGSLFCTYDSANRLITAGGNRSFAEERRPNMKKKTVIKIVVIVLGVIAATWMPIAFLLDAWLKEDPEITYAEFPVEITYTIHGEEITINETYVFEYVKYVAGIGHKYNSYYKGSGDDNLFVLYEDKDSHVSCEMLSSLDYMCLLDLDIDSLLEDSPIWYSYTEEGWSRLTEDQLVEQFGIQIVSWKISAPLDADGNVLIKADEA